VSGRIVRREHYLKMLAEFKDEPLVKIITGMRRCGKSTLMEMFISDIKKSGVPEENIIHINFEDPRYAHIQNGDALLKEVMAATELRDGVYLFFDEIQDVKEWEKAINSMRFAGADVYITGSNAKLLVSDFSTYLSGRYVEIEMYPLSFREYVDFVEKENTYKDKLQQIIKEYFDSAVGKKENDQQHHLFEYIDFPEGENIDRDKMQQIIKEYFDSVIGKRDNNRQLSLVEYADPLYGEIVNKDKLLSDYMLCGGLPYVVLERKSERNTDMILSAIFDTVFIKDIVERNVIKDVAAIRNVAKFVMKNIGNTTSVKSVSDYIVSKGGRITRPTVDAFLDYLESAYLIYRARKYDVKKKEYLHTSDKFYISDLGIGNSIVGYGDNDFSGLIENIVYMELLFRGKKVAVGNIDGNEIDFIVMGKDTREYYQVTTELYSQNVKEREVRSLKMVQDNFPKTIITFQSYPFKNIEGIKVISLADFLLEDFE